jgi:hypothetical protein
MAVQIPLWLVTYCINNWLNSCINDVISYSLVQRGELFNSWLHILVIFPLLHRIPLCSKNWKTRGPPNHMQSWQRHNRGSPASDLNIVTASANTNRYTCLTFRISVSLTPIFPRFNDRKKRIGATFNNDQCIVHPNISTGRNIRKSLSLNRRAFISPNNV